MLQKLFRTKSVFRDVEDAKHTQTLLEAEPWSPPAFNPAQIRVILCQDTGDKTKLTLFDSAYSLVPGSSEERTAELPSSWSGVGFLSGGFLSSSSSSIQSPSVSSNTITRAINIASNAKTAHPIATTTSTSIINNSNHHHHHHNHHHTHHPHSHHTHHPHSHHTHHHQSDNNNLTEGKRRSLDSSNNDNNNKSNVHTLPPSLSRNSMLAIQRKMMFGAVPLAYKGMTTKIHYMKSPKPQILLTKLFSVNTGDLENHSPARRSSFSSVSSDANNDTRADGGNGNNSAIHQCQSSSSRPNSIFNAEEQYSESSDEESLRIPIYSSPSSIFHPGPPILGLRTSGITISSTTSSLSTSPRNTFTNRRIRRFSQTSMENGVFNPTPLPGSLSRIDSSNLSLKSRSIMYAVGVVITLEDNELLEDFLFSHFALLENRLHQLQQVAFKLLCSSLRKAPQQVSISGPNSIFNPPNHRQRYSVPYLSSLMLQNEPLLIEAVMRFKNSLCLLYSTPRIQEPLWLNISTFPTQKSNLAKSFFMELSYLLDNFDDKRTNFFISTLITTVLMYHLSWVPTVAPNADFEDRVRVVKSVIGSKSSFENLSAKTDCHQSITTAQSTSSGDNNLVSHEKSAKTSTTTSSLTNAKTASPIGKNTPADIHINHVDTNNNNHSIDHNKIKSNENNGQRKQQQTSKVSKRTSVLLDSQDVDLCMDQFMDVPMPKSHIPTTIPNSSSPLHAKQSSTTGNKSTKTKSSSYRADQLYVKSYGRSLMVGLCDSYMSDFVLMGLPCFDFQDSLETDLKDSVQQFSLPDEPVTRSFCILGNLDNKNCTVLGYEAYNHHPNSTMPNQSSSTTNRVRIEGDQIRDGPMICHRPQMSHHVYTLLRECKNLFTKMNMPPESASITAIYSYTRI
ncbi:7028_t:CDS:10 [Ambispora gerdemannii]|uniref:7028_t:CDS:1 n=1 Tax=Ambispora gerdemannii TaxID=144530 RepID=A0A9N9FCX4_9GLOM|nr:7028_t:CDS:10 [Ambispora gerdemannii]